MNPGRVFESCQFKKCVITICDSPADAAAGIRAVRIEYVRNDRLSLVSSPGGRVRRVVSECKSGEVRVR